MQSWADMVANSPPRSSRDARSNSPISQQDVDAARAAVTEAEVALRAISILTDRDAYLAKEKLLQELHASYTQILEAAEANAAAIAAAAAAVLLLQRPLFPLCQYTGTSALLMGSLAQRWTGLPMTSIRS